MKNRVSTPFDVKLMNTTASVLLLAFSVMVVGALAGWAARHPVFAIRSITVGGEVTHNNELTLRANVAHKLKGTFLTLDLTAAQHAFEAVPWVRKAIVRREFPNRLNVLLQEQHAQAYWGAEGDSKMVNSFGEVFEANVGEVDQEVLPRLSGPEGQAAQVLSMYQALQPEFDDMDMVIEALDLTGHGGWRARLDTDAVIELGGGAVNDVLATAQRFLKTLTQVTSRYGRTPEALETADLRHKDGYAIRLRGVTTVSADVAHKLAK